MQLQPHWEAVLEMGEREALWRLGMWVAIVSHTSTAVTHSYARSPKPVHEGGRGQR